MKVVSRLLGGAGALTVTAIAGWYLPVVIGSTVLAIVLIVIWVLSSEKRTQRTVEIIKAIREHASTESR